MLGERCTRLILSLDGVLSYGDSTIKQRRKDLIVRVQRFQQYVDVLVERSKSLQNWFTECSLSPIQRLEYDIITQSEQEPRKKCTILYDCFLYQTTDDYFHSLRTEVLASLSLLLWLQPSQNLPVLHAFVSHGLRTCQPLYIQPTIKVFTNLSLCIQLHLHP